MGLTTFYVPQPDRCPPASVRQCYMQGIECIPWEGKNSLKDNLLRIQRSTTESGNLFIPWPVRGRGILTLSTAYLRESPEPYILPVELARGTVGRLRNQIAAWAQLGINVPPEVADRVTLATRALCVAVTSQSQPETAAESAEEAITLALDSIDLMMRAWSDYSLTKAGKRNVFLAANLGARPGRDFPNELLGTINTAVVPFSWSDAEDSNSTSGDYFAEQVRWCKKLGLRICGGPLLNFDRDGLPDWLYLWEEDPDSLRSYMLRYVETTVNRFRGKVSLWHAWAGLNNGQAMVLSEEFRLHVGVAALEVLRTLDPTTPVFVSFNQPFGEYLARQTMDLAPLHYADALIRADLGVSGFGLEMNLGYWPDGTLPRDVLEISRLIDRWSALGLPLVVILTMPSSCQTNSEDSQILCFGGDQLTPETQAQTAAELVRACLAKPAVQGVIWNQLVDGDSAHYPHAGLIYQDGQPKPILRNFAELRKRYLI